MKYNHEKVKRHEKKLRECPFCGNSCIQILIQNYGWLVSCNECSAQIKVFSAYIKSAVLMWNRRNDGTKLENSVHIDEQRKEFEEESTGEQ